MALVNSEWPEHYWYVFHVSSLTAPRNPTQMERKHWKAFYIMFGHAIPCQCRKDYLKLIGKDGKVPFRYRHRLDLFQWTVDVHNRVSQRLKKPLFTYKKALARYTRRPQQQPVVQQKQIQTAERQRLPTLGYMKK
jgi:hypothetical protein